jgi:glycosyltransferase involved in cell wall biosynthesis
LSAKIVIVANTAWNLVNFRSGLIKSLVVRGYAVIAAAPWDEYASQLESLGCRYIKLPMDSMGTHPGRDFLLLTRLLNLLFNERPAIFLAYTVKPNIYGSLAAHILRIPVINNISGLGTVFIAGGWLKELVRGMYRIALSRSAKVFFQNNDDRQLFISARILTASVTDQLPGSGVDLQRFTPQRMPERTTVRFLMASRMLTDKGVVEYVDAARILRQRCIEAEFCLLGFLDAKNPTAISRKQMADWVAEGTVRYLGAGDNVREEIAESDCVVLPSYREGTPRALLEAAAMARPIVTTDSVGCRDVVDDGINGFLCEPRDASDLADKMERIAAMSRAAREVMGLRGREKVEREFDEQIVIEKYLEAIQAVLVSRSKLRQSRFRGGSNS